MCKTRLALFKWRHFEPVIIVCAVRWYLRYSLSYRDVEELVNERGLSMDHTTIWRWVQRPAGTEPEVPPRTKAYQRFLEGGRNLHPSGFSQALWEMIS